jgi:putative colanic acid biosynthesis acetyltransferase WcaF
MPGNVPQMKEERKKVDLSNFDNSETFDQGAGIIKLTLWYFTNVFFFINPAFPFRSVKPFILRLFGARVGKGVIIHPMVSIKFPWKLIIGDHSWIGQRSWLDNVDILTIGNNVVISQGARIMPGGHNYKKVRFTTFTEPVTLEDGSWVGAYSIVMNGVTMHSHSVLAAGSVATKDLEAYMIYQGNPARPVRERVIND